MFALALCSSGVCFATDNSLSTVVTIQLSLFSYLHGYKAPKRSPWWFAIASTRAASALLRGSDICDV